MKKGMWIIIIAILIIGLASAGSYNKLIRLEEGVKEAWAQVENVYQRRLDLVPNLVATVKGYAAHEQETLQGVVDARSKISQLTISPAVINNPTALTQFQQAQEGLSGALSRLLAVVERYPDLKASQNFLALQSQLEGTENRIAVERKRFNEAARAFNSKCRTVPSNIIARFFGFQMKAYFTAEEGAQKAPEVKF